MSRPTNKRKVADALMLKSDIVARYRHGKMLYDTFCLHMQTRGIRCTPWQQLDDVNVLEAIKEAHEFWEPHGYGGDMVVGTYMRDFTGALHHAKFQNLVGKNRGTLLATIRRDQTSACAAMHMGNAGRIIAEADKACTDLNLEATIETELDYVRGVLKGQTGCRTFSPEGCVFLAGVVGSIPAWARCFMSNNDPIVLRNHGSEACRDMIRTPAIRAYLLRKYNYDASPVMALPPAP